MPRSAVDPSESLCNRPLVCFCLRRLSCQSLIGIVLNRVHTSRGVLDRDIDSKVFFPATFFAAILKVPQSS